MGIATLSVLKIMKRLRFEVHLVLPSASNMCVDVMIYPILPCGIHFLYSIDCMIM